MLSFLGYASKTNSKILFVIDQLYLTPASSLIHLRPQLHHLDAYAEQERLSRPREGAGGAGGPGGAGAGAGKEGAGAAGGGAGQGGGGAAKAIHMSIKSAGADSGEVAVDTMIERLRKVQTEPWIKLKYEHENSEKAWSMYENHLIYASAKDASGAEHNDGGKGKEKENAASTVAVAHEEQYRAQWGEEEFLKAVSGLGDNQQGDGKFQGDDEVQIKAEIIDQDPTRRAGTARGRGGKAAPGAAAASATKRGARGGKSVAFKD